ncbi:MAG TPA: helix-turn-helix domain-containing protein [Dehalococcoidia bacterium]|jgi:transcriptional regulator with XRE-family HTH domain|nr:helix-turn-helix domain-containing protein [Dehalococcoidia bacterium]
MTEKFGQLLRKYRRERGFTQWELYGELSQRDPHYTSLKGGSIVSRWESGQRRPPPYQTILALEEILEVPDGMLARAAGYPEAKPTARTWECKELVTRVTVPWGIVEHLDVTLPANCVWIDRFKVVANEASTFTFSIRARGGGSIDAVSEVLNLGTTGLVLEYPLPVTHNAVPLRYRDWDNSQKLHLAISWSDTIYLKERPPELDFTVDVWVRPIAGHPG